MIWKDPETQIESSIKPKFISNINKSLLGAVIMYARRGSPGPRQFPTMSIELECNIMVDWLLRPRYPRQPLVEGVCSERWSHLNIETLDQRRPVSGEEREKDRRVLDLFWGGVSPSRRGSAERHDKLTIIREDERFLRLSSTDRVSLGELKQNSALMENFPKIFASMNLKPN